MLPSCRRMPMPSCSWCPSGMDRRRDVVRSVEMLHQINAPIVGTVLNRAPEADSYAYYHYGYGTAQRKNRRAVAPRRQPKGSRHADQQRTATATVSACARIPMKIVPVTEEEASTTGQSMGRHAKRRDRCRQSRADPSLPETGDAPASSGPFEPLRWPRTDIDGSAGHTCTVTDRSTGCSTAKARNTRTGAGVGRRVSRSRRRAILMLRVVLGCGCRDRLPGGG